MNVITESPDTAPYLLAAYGIAGLVLCWIAASSLWQYWQLKRAIAHQQQREAAMEQLKQQLRSGEI